MAVAAILAITLPQTIWRLTEIKLELLCQVAPAVLLGIRIPSLSGKNPSSPEWLPEPHSRFF